MKSAKALATTAIALSLLALTACSSGSKSGSAASSSAPVVRNLLTNLVGANGPVLAVKIDDTEPAHPQIGLDKADVVYIEQVEGGLSRIAAIFSDPTRLPELIGPVRSARISDLDILAQYGHVGFAFSGAQTLFYPMIDSANLTNLSADRNPATMYSRDNTRFAPTNLILHPHVLLDAAINQQHKQVDTVKPIGFTFGAAPAGGTTITSAAFHWPASHYVAQWNATLGQWTFTYDGKPDLAADGAPLGSPTLIIQNVSITDSQFKDRHGGVTPFSNTVGSGTAYLLRDGKEFPILWNRASATVGTTWTTPDGKPANMGTGQIWIALTDNPPVFTYPVSPTTQATSTPSSK